MTTIGPTPERLAKAGPDVEAFAPDENIHFQTIRLLDTSPLSKLAKIGRKAPEKGINGEQFGSGVRFYADAYYGRLLSTGVMDTTKERVDCSGFVAVADRVMAAQTRFNRAIKALDRDAKDVLSDIVLADMPLKVFANRYGEFQQPRERRAIALNLLRKALDQLTDHYYPPRNVRMSSSHVSGYRPQIGGVENPE